MCRTGCPTQNHASWGECARAARVNIGYCGIGGGDLTAQKRWDSELEDYRKARAAGIQPDGTTRNKVREAVALSDAAGAAYGRDFSKATPMEA
jgi:hypothetical protein